MGVNAQTFQFLLSQVRASGVALSGGKVYFYVAGTENLKTVWLDRGKTTEAANPYTLDANATAQVFGDGLYDVVIKDASNVTKYEWENISVRDISGNVYDAADYGNSLNAAVASIGSTPATLQYASDVTATANLVIPSNIELMPLNGAVINHGAYTISYAGSTARWPLAQIFNGTGLVTGLDAASPEFFGAVGDGVNDDYAALNKMSLAVRSGGQVMLHVGKNYLHNTAATITFATRVEIKGTGTITIGAGVGQRPAIVIAGEGSTLEDFSVVGDSSGFTNGTVTAELRRLIKVTGDHVHMKRLNVSEGIYAIEYSATDGGSVTYCRFRNDTINHDTIATYPNQNNCQAIYATGDCTGLQVSNNYAFGYGQFLFSGQRNRAFRVTDNRMEKQGDNGLYLSLIGSTITGNVGENIRQSAIKGFFTTSNISHNEAYTTGSYVGYAGIFVQALNNYTGQEVDVNGNNSYGNIVQGNIVDGNYSSAGIIGTENPVDGSGYESVLIDSNTIRGRSTTATATSGMVGVQMILTSADRKTWGSALTNNLISQVYRAASITAPATGYNRFARISGNRVHRTVENGMSISYLDRSIVSDNIIFDAIGTTVTPNVFSLTGVTNTKFSNNYTGNSSTDGKFSKHYLENSACSGNEYINNKIEQAVYSAALHYTINDATARISIPTAVRERSITGPSGFSPGEGHIFIITPNGNGYTYNPTGQFPAGYEMTVINNAASAYNLIFDSTGLNATIAQGTKASFVYTGTAWK